MEDFDGEGLGAKLLLLAVMIPFRWIFDASMLWMSINYLVRDTKTLSFLGCMKLSLKLFLVQLGVVLGSLVAGYVVGYFIPILGLLVFFFGGLWFWWNKSVEVLDSVDSIRHPRVTFIVYMVVSFWFGVGWEQLSSYLIEKHNPDGEAVAAALRSGGQHAVNAPWRAMRS